MHYDLRGGLQDGSQDHKPQQVLLNTVRRRVKEGPPGVSWLNKWRAVLSHSAMQHTHFEDIIEMLFVIIVVNKEFPGA